jgi:divalent metal cation (Fe/Co/Zn/Cd) transporter
MSVVQDQFAIHHALTRRGTRLEYLTIVWNSMEALVSILAGVVAGSIALIGFGLDSVIETSSGAILLWRLGHEHDPERRERAERTALRLVGWSFLLLAAYVSYDAIKALISREPPDTSIAGIVIATRARQAQSCAWSAERRHARRFSPDRYLRIPFCDSSRWPPA